MQHRRRRVLPILLLAAVVGVPAALAPAGPVPSAVVAAAAQRPYRLDLADGNDFVAQTNFVQCVGASMQMMLNVMGEADRSSRTQGRLQTLARSLSGPARAGFQRKGASVRGWTAGLNELGAGPYRTVGSDDIDEALRLAAKSIRATGRPVGLLVWAGRHAWVMTGFQATADPAATDRYRVTKAIVMDPLYPYGSKKWGRSPRPREALSPATLGRQFVPRRQGMWAGAVGGVAGASMAALAGKYVIVMPYTPVALARARHVPA